MQHPRNSNSAKTKPPPNSTRPLSPRQLAAARLLAAGRSIPDITAELRIHRTTIYRWYTSNPTFLTELRRLHNLFAQPPQAFAPSKPAYRTQRDPDHQPIPRKFPPFRSTATDPQAMVLEMLTHFGATDLIRNKVPANTSPPASPPEKNFFTQPLDPNRSLTIVPHKH